MRKGAGRGRQRRRHTGALRALALATLVATTGSAPGKLVRESMEDKDPPVRAAR